MEAQQEIQYFHCKGCSCRRAESDYDIYKGLRRKICNFCKELRTKNKCEHNRRKQTCKECGGSEICEHNRRKSKCRECGGVSICEHNKHKSQCKECGGGSICEHNRRKSECKECGGASICEHNRRKSDCKECGGSGICEHNKHKSTCKECGGSAICEHNKNKYACKECSPNKVLVNLVRIQVTRSFRNSKLTKINHSIDYLSCDTDFLKKHIQDKMVEGMTFDNIHIDHIKPVSRFNLDDEDELLKCCHFTNLQPLFSKDNLEKNNKWTDEDETYWNKNIIYNPDFKDIYYIK